MVIKQHAYSGVVATQLQGALCIFGFHIHRFNQLQMENISLKIPESSKKQNLNLLCAGTYLQSIYIALGIVSNPGMI